MICSSTQTTAVSGSFQSALASIIWHLPRSPWWNCNGGQARLDAHDVARSEIREVHDIGAMLDFVDLDFVDPDGIQLELIFIDLEKLQRGT